MRASVPVVALRRPHLRSLTASAAFDCGGAFKIVLLVTGVPAVYAGAPLDHFRLSEDWSTVTPGPMVELSEIF